MIKVYYMNNAHNQMESIVLKRRKYYFVCHLPHDSVGSLQPFIETPVKTV
jgi:hypothetical protein